eukprot:2137082-Rhodomonas_salina.1
MEVRVLEVKLLPSAALHVRGREERRKQHEEAARSEEPRREERGRMNVCVTGSCGGGRAG